MGLVLGRFIWPAAVALLEQQDAGREGQQAHQGKDEREKANRGADGDRDAYTAEEDPD